MNPTIRRSLERAIAEAFALAPAEASAVLSVLEPQMLRGGDWLFRQGDPGEALYLLARGRLQVWITATEAGQASDSLVAEVAPGETVGEISLLSGGTRSAGIRAVRDSLLLRMDAATFDRLAREQPGIVRRLAGGIATRLRERTGGAQSGRRALRTIALVPAGDPALATALASRLATALQHHGPLRNLDPKGLGASGAPPLPADADAAPSAAFTDWLAAQEDEHRFVLMVTDGSDSAWSRLAPRHADAVLRVARADDVRARDALAGSSGPSAGPPGVLRALVLLHDGVAATIGGTGAWLAASGAQHHFHVREGSEADIARLARMLAGESVGLVLGGGAARGLAHLGVYRALVEAGRPIDWFGGASIGAIMAAGMATGGSPEALTALARKSFVEGRPFGDFTLPVMSLLRGGRMERMVGANLGGAIEDLPLPFFCVSSNLGLGRLQVHDRGSLPRALRASVSLPGIFPPAVVDGELAIDGGILDNLPVDEMLRRPVGRVIAVDLTSPRSFNVDYDAAPSPWAVLAGRLLPFRRRYRVPGLMSLMLKATEIGTMEKVAASGRRADLLIKPPVSRFSITDVSAFDQIVEAGYAHTRAMLAEGVFA